MPKKLEIKRTEKVDEALKRLGLYSSKEVEVTIADEVVGAIEEGKLYDFVASESHRMTRDDLRLLAVELVYALGDMNVATKKSLIEEVRERLI